MNDQYDQECVLLAAKCGNAKITAQCISWELGVGRISPNASLSKYCLFIQIHSTVSISLDSIKYNKVNINIHNKISEEFPIQLN